MTPNLVVPLMVFAIPLAAIVGGVFLVALKILKGDGPRRNGRSEIEETRMIQELHRDLTRMEERVEALETLLLEKSKHGKTHE